MAYTKTVWKDRVVEKPRNYTMANNADGSVTLTPAQGVITEAGTPIIAANLNNIENKVEEFDKLMPLLVKKGTTTITYYVNATSGSDNNSGLTSGTAFKTIGKAISLLPDVINYTVTINIADGIYDEDVYINGKVGNGGIVIQGTSRLNTLIRYVECNQCVCQVTLMNFATTTKATDTIRIFRCSYVYIYNCMNNASLTGCAAFQFISSTGCVDNCLIAYAYVGVQASIGSCVLVQNCSGTGNTYRNYATSSIIYIDGTQHSGTDRVSDGGKVSETLQSIGGAGYYKLDNGLMLQWATVGTGSLAANQLYAGTYSFPITFPNKCVAVLLSVQSVSNSSSRTTAWSPNTPTASGFTIAAQTETPNNVYINYLALGY